METSPQEDTGLRRSTRHYAVDDLRAELLARRFDAYSVVEIREYLEFKPVKRAVGLLEWASKKPDPYRCLKRWAKKHGKGYYRPRAGRPGPVEEHRRCSAYLLRKEGESLKKRGRGLSQGETERLARLWFAPSYRAEVGKVPLAVRADHEVAIAEDEEAA